MTAARSFECRPQAVTAARRFVREALSGEGAELIDAAELMTSELTSNCVRHAGTAFEVSVRTRAAGDEIRIEVRDSGGGQPRPLSPGPDEPSGRGLMIVEALSESWGVEPGGDGKIVWFTLARSPAGALAGGSVSGAAG
ncbi:MAG TPA: ATP-binding protein [Solirubrobacteraceae bacterium]